MYIKVFFDESEMEFEDFDCSLALLKKALDCWYKLSCFYRCHVEVYKGVPDETQKKETCNKSVCKQRRNKTVNASKSS